MGHAFSVAYSLAVQYAPILVTMRGAGGCNFWSLRAVAALSAELSSIMAFRLPVDCSIFIDLMHNSALSIKVKELLSWSVRPLVFGTSK